MSVLKSAFSRATQIGYLSNCVAKKLILTPKLASPTTNVALFATASKPSSGQLSLPKKPPTAYFMFRNEVYEKIKKKNPRANAPELATVIGQKWQELDDAKKEAYKGSYMTAMVDFNAKMAAIEADPKLNLQLAQIKEERAKKMANRAHQKAKLERKSLLKDLGRPKLDVRSAYSIFFKENFPKLHKKGNAVTVATKDISEKWNMLAPERKQPYQDAYTKIKEVYDMKLAAWNEKLNENLDDAESVENANKKLAQKTKRKKKLNEVEE